MILRDFIGIIRELSFSDIRQEAMIPPRVLVLAPSVEQGEEWARHLLGESSETFADVVDRSDQSSDPLSYDVLISVGEIDPARARKWADLFRRANAEMLLVEIDPAMVPDARLIEHLRRRICDLARDRTVAFGRYIHSMRTAATAEIVSDTSRVNAQFAALSNIPALIPVVGTIFAAGADFIVLTKNQLMMMYRLAAIHDRDLDNRWQVFAELTPVVGTALLWRTAARQVAAVLPVFLGAVPKVAIAYAGTFAVGQAARLYYEHGPEFGGETLESMYRDAIERFKSEQAGSNAEPVPNVAIETRNSAS